MTTEPSAPVSMRTVRGDGVDLAVFERGDPDRTSVVLVHGYPDDHTVWDGVAERLASRFHVVTYDVRGAGRSAVPADRAGYDLSHLSADLAAVIDATCGEGPVHLVGHDWGSIQSWEAVCTAPLDQRLSSFTSIAGPSLDHVAHWMRSLARPEVASLRRLAAQGLRSWYIALFQVPALADAGWRTVVPRAFTRYLHRVEGTPAGHPSSSLPSDGANGIELYRRNVPERLRRPRQRRTDVPVQLIVARQDRFVTPSMLEAIDPWVTDLQRREVDGRHWLPAADPGRVADWVSEFIEAHSR